MSSECLMESGHKGCTPRDGPPDSSQRHMDECSIRSKDKDTDR